MFSMHGNFFRNTPPGFRGELQCDAYHTGMQAAILRLIKEESVDTVFQPIFDLHTGGIVACEALTRIPGKAPFSGPEDLFDAARTLKLTAQLEQLCRKRALLNAHQRKIPVPISINVCPSVLKCPDHQKGVTASLVEELFNVRDNIILELTEKYYIRDHLHFSKTVDYYRQQGFNIAIDDLGSGFAGLKMLKHIKPFMVKIDRSLISGIDTSSRARALVQSLVNFCHNMDTVVVGEGIEREQELEVLMELNVDMGQGYLLSPPLPRVAQDQVPEVLQCRLTTTCHVETGSVLEISNCVESLALKEQPVGANVSVAEVVRRFRLNEAKSCIPVVEENRPVGIVHKNRLFYRLGQPYGYDLFSRKPVKSVMEPALIFETGTALETVSQSILARDEQTIYDAIIVVHHGQYLGIVKIHHILQRITQQKINLAKQANPLTGLPGNHMIQKEVLRRLAKDQDFAVMYYDLDNFKPFNDRFGFDHGDRVIRFVADLLKDELTRFDRLAFLGHVGGDDFISVCSSENVHGFAQRLISQFDQRIKTFFDSETRHQGYYKGKNRQGQYVEIPLLSISIAVVINVGGNFESFDQLISIAAKVKQQAKAQPGSSVAVFPDNSPESPNANRQGETYEY